MSPRDIIMGHKNKVKSSTFICIWYITTINSNFAPDRVLCAINSDQKSIITTTIETQQLNLHRLYLPDPVIHVLHSVQCNIDNKKKRRDKQYLIQVDKLEPRAGLSQRVRYVKCSLIFPPTHRTLLLNYRWSTLLPAEGAARSGHE